MRDTQAEPSRAYRAWILIVLICVYTFNFIDRQIVGVLAIPIKTELKLDDAQLGLMGGVAFASFYTLLGIPIAALADRFSKTWVMTIALALWSGFTAACGLAGSFVQLFLCRMGVGVGEAGGVAPAYALISEYFPAGQRSRALAIYSFGIPIGSALGVLFGGQLAARFDWRTAFEIVGLSGLILVPVLRLSVRDRKRDPQRPRPRVSLGATLATLLPKPSFWFISLGAACSSIVGYGLIFWLPSFFKRSYHMSLQDISLYYGAILLIGGTIGVWCGGALGDRFGQRSRAAYLVTPALAFLAAIPCYWAALSVHSTALAFVLFLAPQALALAWLGPVLAAVQQLAPAGQRTLASAAFLFINNLVGIGFGTWFFGYVSKALAPHWGEESLRWSILLGVSFYALAAALLLIGAMTLRRDWVDDA